MSNPEVLLKARDLVKTFTTKGRGVVFQKKNVFTAVDNVSFDVVKGETLAIVGESGSGKSTSARLVARLLDVTSGTVEFEGEDVTRVQGEALKKFRSQLQVVFQDPYSSLNPRHKVHDIIAAPLLYLGIKPKEGVRNRVRDLLERVGLNPDHSDRYPMQFSGGQAQRIGIARALAVNPELVICDEAVSALDVSVQAQVINLLKDLQADLGLSYIFIAHDLAVVRQIASRVVVMQNGKVAEQGERDQIFENPQDEYTQVLLSSVPSINPEWELRRREMMEKENIDHS